MRIKNLVISGGSVRSIAVIGCLQYLFQELGGGYALDSIVNVVGTSAGAIIALMLVLGYRPMEMKMAMKDMLLVKGYHKLGFDDLLELRVFESFGMDSGQAVQALIEDLMNNKGYDPSMTFVDLAKKTGKNLVICVSNLTQQMSEYKCVDETPNMPVSTAIRMSVSLPILFAPVRYDDDIFVDGALYESLPLGYIASKFKDSLRDTLAIRTGPPVGGNQSKKMDNIISYFNVMISSLLHKANEGAIQKALASKSTESKITIFDIKPDAVEADGNLFGFDMVQLNFCISDKSIDDAVSNGYYAFAKFIGQSNKKYE